MWGNTTITPNNELDELTSELSGKRICHYHAGKMLSEGDITFASSLTQTYWPVMFSKCQPDIVIVLPNKGRKVYAQTLGQVFM